MPSTRIEARSWTVWRKPKGVEWVYVTLSGAGSGGRPGGRVEGRINVKSISALYVLCGAAGGAPSGSSGGAGGLPGGADGGDGGSGLSGGWGGGGATVIRAGSQTGAIRAVAGGAGGNSGDYGRGGAGGDEVGEAGSPAPGYPGAFQPNPEDFPLLWDYEAVGNATGGTQIQGGNRGTSASGSYLDGNGSPDTPLGTGGRGGGGYEHVYGGGGGGGGYFSGGGGQAGGELLQTPGGGGAGGSNFVEAVVGATSMRGEGSTGHGSVVLSWDNPGDGNQPPTPPTEVKHGDVDIAGDDYQSLVVERLPITAKVNNPERNQPVRMVAQYTHDQTFRTGVKRVISTYKDPGKRASVALTGLTQNTRYYVRLYGEDRPGLISRNYTTFNFWTNRFPTEPEISSPGENAKVSELSSVVFQWTHQDPDENSTQSAFRLRWRRKALPGQHAGDWVWAMRNGHSATQVDVVVWDNLWTEDPGTFKANTWYEFQVATRDQQGAWGVYSIPRSFFIEGETAPPTPLSPAHGEAVGVETPVVFEWMFRDPSDEETQGKADLRYRVMSPGLSEEEGWVTLLGDTISPGANNYWALLGETLAAGYHYEWQVRTQDSTLSDTSDWSDSEDFWTVVTPGLGVPALVTNATTIDTSLGCGHHRIFLYDRGGKVLRGEITPLARVNWGRRRDDIYSGIFDTNGFDADCAQLLREMRCWLHEIVVFRDGVRVFEGPITRISLGQTNVEIEAKDVMAYVYRRIMRQGYNDAFRIVNGEQVGLSSAVERATRIIMNALAPDDPNVLPYLTSLNYPDDARVSRSVPDFSRTAWEEVDDLAATGGIDYTTVGRRIVVWDTHRPLGRLPELRESNFLDPPVVSEYGMQLATGFGVTNNNGVYGFAERDNTPDNAYGIIEQLASAYGEEESQGNEETMTSESRTRLEEILTAQAERNIAGRYPTPLVVRVPDGSTLTADTPVNINDLVPGVWIPLRAKTAVREVAQWQKLDLLTVEETEAGERVMVTMSPAPNQGEDPDAVGAVEEG
jgi:hypothetical protein